MENKNEGNENKIILGDFNCTMDKMETDGRNKTFMNVISIMLCQNSSWIMDWRIRYNRSSGTRSTIDRVLTNITMARNTKINHIMLSFTDHYNAIFIDRFSSKT